MTTHLCECGCGQATPIATRSKASRGHVKGQPLPRLRGHGSKLPTEQRFWSRVTKTETCWLWSGKLHPAGYGVLRHEKKDKLAHRYSYEALVGPIPDGLVIDHLCRVRNCVNPEHLEPVANAENIRRGMSPNVVVRRTNVCRKGHEGDFYVFADGTRACRKCSNERRRARRAEVAA